MFLIGALALSVFALTPEVSEHLARLACQTGDLRLTLEMNNPEQRPVLCISPELSTTLFFDRKLGRVELDGRESFRRILMSEEGFTLVPSEAVRDAAVLALTVHFADGAASASARFLLVIHPSLAARQVDVTLQMQSVLFYQQQARQAEARVAQCEEERMRQGAGNRGTGGLRGLREAGLMSGRTGVKAQALMLKQKPGEAVRVEFAWSYRADGRVAVEVQWDDAGTSAWRAESAELRTLQGEALPLLPLVGQESRPGQKGYAMVELEMADVLKTQGPYTLTLWDADKRAVTLGQVTFP